MLLRYGHEDSITLYLRHENEDSSKNFLPLRAHGVVWRKHGGPTLPLMLHCHANDMRVDKKAIES
jgi:hypothetical protein